MDIEFERQSSGIIVVNEFRTRYLKSKSFIHIEKILRVLCASAVKTLPNTYFVDAFGVLTLCIPPVELLTIRTSE